MDFQVLVLNRRIPFQNQDKNVNLLGQKVFSKTMKIMCKIEYFRNTF